MLFVDIKLQIPCDKRYERKKRANDVYLYYRLKSQRVNGRLKHERIAVGKIVKDAKSNTEYLIPNENYYSLNALEPPRGTGVKLSSSTTKPRAKKDDSTRAYAYAIAAYNIAQELKLMPLLIEAFNEELAHEIMALSSFIAMGSNLGMSNIDYYCYKNRALIGRDIYIDDIPTIYSSIDSNGRNDFLRTWIKLRTQTHCVCYEANSGTLYGTYDNFMLPIYNSLIFCSLDDGMPLYYDSYLGHINDFDNYREVKEKASLMGLMANPPSLVLDHNYMAKDIFEHEDISSLSLIVEATYDERVRDYLIAWQLNSDLKSHDLRQGISMHEESLTQSTRELRLLMYKTCASKYLYSYQALSDEQLWARDTVFKDQELSFNNCTKHDVVDDDSFERQQIQEIIDLGGFLALYVNDHSIDRLKALSWYQAKDRVAHIFSLLDEDSSYDSFRVVNQESSNMKMFIAFIALIIHTELRKRLTTWLLEKGISFESAVIRLNDIECYRDKDSFIVNSKLTSAQQDLLKILNLDKGQYSILSLT